MWHAFLGLWMAGFGMVMGPAVMIRVDNSAHVPEGVLVRAEDTTSRILRAAGVQVVWVDAEAAGGRSLGPWEFRLHIVDKRPARLTSDAAGYAAIFPAGTGAENYAGVFYPAVKGVAGGLSMGVHQMMGLTMAHEIGHLLLGARAHSRIGIMSPQFREREARLAERGELLFSQEEARRMRGALEALMGLRLKS